MIYLVPEDYPCRCLCRGSSQMTRTTPFRRISLHFSQMRLTLDRTFMSHPPAQTAGSFHHRQVNFQDIPASDPGKPGLGIFAHLIPVEFLAQLMS